MTESEIRFFSTGILVKLFLLDQTILLTTLIVCCLQGHLASPIPDHDKNKKVNSDNKSKTIKTKHGHKKHQTLKIIIVNYHSIKEKTANFQTH